ncbi:RsmD family RNA methyltransferase [Candidatus Woesearchaeota archaeon]|nr:RsmD family RNA methyltransferase [Candidatus Woesearchaeota archaeon]
MLTKKQLAIQLSKLAVFEKPKLKLEQYPTDSEVASIILWDALMKGDIVGKKVADLGAGTGILGIGALLLGAEQVYFIEKDSDAVAILRQNLLPLRLENYTLLQMDVSEFQDHVDTVFQNPPFGTKQAHADKPFMEKAFSLAKIVYSFHKTTTDAFVRAIAGDYFFSIAEVYHFAFPLRQTQSYHRKKLERIEVTCYRLVKR